MAQLEQELKLLPERKRSMNGNALLTISFITAHQGSDEDYTCPSVSHSACRVAMMHRISLHRSPPPPRGSRPPPPGHGTRGPLPPNMGPEDSLQLVTSGGHHWRPIQMCSVQVSPSPNLAMISIAC